MKTLLILLALAPFVAATSAAETPVASPAIASSAEVPALLQGEWVVDFDATIALAKSSPKWRASDEQAIPMMQKVYGGFEVAFTATDISLHTHGQKQGGTTILKAREGETLVLECQPPTGIKSAPMIMRATFPQKDRLNLRMERNKDMDFVVWMKKPAGWKPASKKEAAGAILGTAVTQSLATKSADKPSPSGATPASAKPQWEKDRWSNDSAAYVVNDTMTPAAFETFCKEHADARSLQIENARQLTSLAPIAALTQLTALELRGLTASRGDRIDLAPLASLTALENLNCYGTSVVNAASLANLTKLKKISFYASRVDSLDALAGMTALEDVDLYGFGHTFKDYAPLARLPIKRINVYMNEQATPQNLAVFKGSATLERFEANLTKTVTNIEFLADSPNLTSVKLWSNPVTDITPLRGKAKLTELTLWDTKVADVTPLADCVSLADLNLSGTPVTDIAPLLGLKKLNRLKLPAGVPAAQIEQLKAALPKLSLTVDKPKK